MVGLDEISAGDTAPAASGSSPRPPPASEPAGHDEYDTIEQALIDNYTDIDHPVFKQLSRLAEKAATWFGEALANKNVKPLRQGKEYVYISTMRPLAGVSIEGIIADVDGGSKSVLWRDAPVSLNDQKHLDLIPYSKEAVSGAVQDYSDATLAKSQRPLAKIEKPEKPAAEAEEFETPEEARTEEAKLEVEAAEKVRPNLYIGNVTPGMKARIADAMDWSAKDIRDFTEGGWKVKRTPIEMTRSEAEEYLNWLEADLNRRLEENKINTRNEMAWANGDWGDVKALRKSLGLEVGPRPWYIVPGTKDVQVTRTEDLKKEYANLATLNKELRASEDEDRRSEIEDAISAQEEVIIQMEEAAGKSAKVLRTPGQAITAATRPSSLEESNMTVQEVLGAVMKRGARMAKMAYAAGRRELREAQRIKARAKARMNSAIADIKRKVPSSVDLLYRDAIDAIKSQIDPHLRAEETLKKRQSLRDYIKAHPDMAALVAPDKMRSFLKTLDMLGKKSFNEYTIGEFEDIAAQINKLRSLGSLRRKLEIHEYERSKQRDIEKLKKGSVKIQNLKLLRPKEIGGKLTREERAVNIYVKARNFAAQKWRSVATPMDVLFDLLDGTKEYKGPNFKLFKEGLDKQWSRYFDLRDEVCQPILQLGRDFGMNEGNYERIGVYAALQQDNGRKKLLDTGYDEQQIDAVQLTKEEMRIYEKMREAYDSLVPEIEAVMRDVYNEKFVRERNYFPMLTDWEAMTSNEIQDIFTDKLIELPEGIKKNVPRKFTIERIGGTQKIKINALEIFLQHIDSASYLIEMGAEVKRLSEIAATAEYADAVGNVGQAEVRSWLDLMSRKGGVQYGKTIPALDTFRRHIGAAVIGFRLSTALVNATPLVDGAGIIGNYAFKGASDIATSPEWRAFVLKNFPEYRDRVGGDIEFLEFGTTTIEKAEEIGFYPLKYIDGLAAASVAVGAYQKYMIESGLDVDLSKPNAEAITYAQRVMRRTQSSAFYKDLPSVFTRGTFSGNRSIDRLLFQFQSFMVNRWSLIEHDMIRSGIKTGNVGKAMNIFFYLALAGFAEMGIRRLTKELIALLTGEDTEDWSETFTRELVVNTLQNIPFVSQGVSTYNYGNVPVPAISLIEQMTERFNRIKRTKSPSKRRLQALELLLLSSGVVAGVPGTVQALEIVESKRKR